MSKDPVQEQNEVDLIQLFEYFKNGLKAIVGFFGNIISFLIKLMVLCYVLIKKKWMVVVVCAIVGALVGFVYQYYFVQPQKYSMVVETYYDTPEALYNLISESDQLVKEHKVNELSTLFKTDLETASKISRIHVSPVKDYDEVLRLYYGDSERDSMFFKDNTIETFLKDEKLLDTQFRRHTINITASDSVNTQHFGDAILDKIRNNAVFADEQKAFLASIKEQEEGIKRQISTVDSLLMSVVSLKERSATRSSTSGDIYALGEIGSKNHLENDLLDQLKALRNELSGIRKEGQRRKKIIRPLTPFNKVEYKRDFPVNPLSTGKVGLWLGLLIVLLPEAKRRLDKYAKKALSNF